MTIALVDPEKSTNIVTERKNKYLLTQKPPYGGFCFCRNFLKRKFSAETQLNYIRL